MNIKKLIQFVRLHCKYVPFHLLNLALKVLLLWARLIPNVYSSKYLFNIFAFNSQFLNFEMVLKKWTQNIPAHD